MHACIILQDGLLLQIENVWQNSVMKRTYLDYAASTPIDSRVADMMLPFMTVSFGNPSAIHYDGLVARRAIEDAREKIAHALGVSRTTCVFTSSATESISLAFLGTIAEWKKSHKEISPEILLSPIEHEAVRSFARRLEGEGVIIRYLPVNEFGVITPRDVFERLTKNTVFVSIGLVNNEIGTIQPIAEIAKEIRRYRKLERGVTRDKSVKGDDIYPLLHTDATQAINYHDMNVPRLGVDLLSCNSTKIYGPKGIGLLYRGSHVLLETHLVGGGQEFGLRSGTEDTASIVGFAEAFDIAQHTAIEETLRLLPLREQLLSSIHDISTSLHIPVLINGPLGEARVVNNVHFSFDRVNHEYLAILLDNEGFSVSTKSACDERKSEESHVLSVLATYSQEERPLSGIRVSIGKQTVLADIEAFAGALKKVLPLALEI